MTVLLWIVGLAAALLILVELACRFYHRRRYGMPFVNKVSGEYPYSQFIEKVDPPIFFRFKKNFTSKMVNLNRFRCRGPQPAPAGRKKRFLLLGESITFGVRLRREEHLWSLRLQEILDRRHPGRWEVLNASNPTYNTVQHYHLWKEQMARLKPDAVVINLGGNDVSQAWMYGGKWREGTPWPWEFIMALERKTPWWQHLLGYFCFYFLLRRRHPVRKAFPRLDPDFQWEAVKHSVARHYRLLAELAREHGATRLAHMSYGFAYGDADNELSPRQMRALDAIQSNWRSFVEGRAAYDDKMAKFLEQEISPELGLEVIPFQQRLSQDPRRHQYYLDLAHFNRAGHKVMARIIYQELDRLGWWEQ